MAVDQAMGIDVCSFGGSSIYLAFDCLLFSSIASSAFVFSFKSLFDFIFFYRLVSRFFAAGDRLFFARLGLSAFGLSFENQF